MPGPLAMLEVLELSRVLAAPWAAQKLADLGEEIETLRARKVI